MGKSRNQDPSSSTSSSFMRMNFLYQASLLTSNLSARTPLSCYYGRLMREISMKMVEKIHPDIKRTICCACCNSLIGTNNLINVRIKSHPKRRKKFKDPVKKQLNKYVTPVTAQAGEGKNDVIKYRTYKKSRTDMRNKRPNSLNYTCRKCGFSKTYLQKPDYDIWIHQIQDL